MPSTRAVSIKEGDYLIQLPHFTEEKKTQKKKAATPDSTSDEKGFPNSPVLTFSRPDISLLGGAVLCTAICLTASLASSNPPTNRDSQKYPQTLPNVLREQREEKIVPQ